MIKKAAKKYFNLQYHKRHKKLAISALKNIEIWNGKTDNNLIRQSDEYSIEVLGSKKFAPWLYVYSAISKEFKEGWIPDNYYGKIVIPSLKGKYGEVSDLRLLQKSLLDTNKFPDLYYRVNGLWLDRNLNFTTPNLIKDNFTNSNSKAIIKKDSSSQGRGVLIMSKKDVNIGEIEISENFVIQSYIEQHPFFDEFSDTSVATLRLTTFINDKGEVSIRGAYLRIGRQFDSYVKSKSAIKIGVDVESGELDVNGYTPDWLLINKHPDTKTEFKYKNIPSFMKCVDTVKNLHSKVPFVRIVGWDLIVDKNEEVKIMEWNGMHNDIKFSEAVQGPIFKGLGFDNIWKNQL